MKAKALIFILYLFSSCVEENKTCAPNYIGRFQIDMSLVTDNDQRKFIQDKGWDQIFLVSDSTGIYRFDTHDPLLKSAEGTWRVISNGIEGGCMGVIKQNNLSGEISFNAFQISIQIAPNRYIGLPFRKSMK